MEAQLSELYRLLQNLIRLGTVAEVDGVRARVQFVSIEETDADDVGGAQGHAQLGGNITSWLRWTAARAGNARTWWRPSVGEQVVVLSPGGDLAGGIIFASLYSDDHPAPSLSESEHLTDYPDGAIVRYDFASHVLAAILPEGGSALLTAPASVTVNTQSATVNADMATLNAPESRCTGNLTVDGLITGKGGLALSADGSGPAAVITGGLQATEDIVAGDISLQGHHHTEQGDGAATSAAQS